jgi:hypothetical protein
MAGKGSNYFCSVYDNTARKNLITKIFFNVKDANAWCDEMKEKYESPAYTVTREIVSV